MATVLQSKEQVQTPVQVPHRWRFTLEQYYYLGELGIFGDQRTELIGGDIYMSPIGPRHSVRKTYARRTVESKLQKTIHMRVDDPLSIGENEPVPDIAIVEGTPSDYNDQHPTTALLVIEISDTTLEFDRTVKASLYASASIPEYWIVNLNEGVLEVYREPAPMENTPFGAGYKQVRRYIQEETVSPLFDPEVSIPVKSLFEGES